MGITPILVVLVLPALFISVMIVLACAQGRAATFARVVLLILGLLAFGAFMGPFGLLLWLMAASLIVEYLLISRHALAVHVLSTVAAAMRQQLPLPTALEFAARGQKGKWEAIPRRLARWLAQGLPLSEALRLAYPQCPPAAVAMIAAAEPIHQVPQALASIEADLARQNIENRTIMPVNPAYPLVVLVMASVIVFGLMVFVVPAYQNIFSEMGYKLPPSTRLLIWFSNDLRSGLLMAPLGSLLLALPLGLYVKFRPRRPARPYLLSRLGDWLKWRMPVQRGLEWNRALAQTAGFLKMSLESGATVDAAIAGAAELDVNNCFRRRLRRWHRLVTAGESAADAAHRCSLGSTLAWAFDAEINPNNAPAVLGNAESFYRSNYSYLAGLSRFILWPLTTVALAGVVGFVVYAMFMPLVTLLNMTMDTVMP